MVLVLGHHELGFGDFWPPYPCTMHLFYRIVGILYHRICRIVEFLRVLLVLQGGSQERRAEGTVPSLPCCPRCFRFSPASGWLSGL